VGTDSTKTMGSILKEDRVSHIKAKPVIKVNFLLVVEDSTQVVLQHTQEATSSMVEGKHSKQVEGGKDSLVLVGDIQDMLQL